MKERFFNYAEHDHLGTRTRALPLQSLRRSARKAPDGRLALRNP